MSATSSIPQMSTSTEFHSASAVRPNAPAILVFRSATLGDFILACPALRLLKQTYPDARVVLLTTQSGNRAIRDSVARYSPTSPIPWVELAMPHLIDEVVLLGGSPTMASLWALRSQLRGYQIKQGVLLLDPAAPWRGRFKKLLLLRFLLGGVPLLGWRARGSLSGNKARLKEAGLLPHHVHGSAHFLGEMKPPRSYQERDIVFDLRLSPQSDNWVDEWWYSQALSGKTVIAVAPGSIQPHKRWPIARFAELCAQLLAEYPAVHIVVIGTPSDTALGAELASELGPRAISLAGQTSVSQLASLLKRCDLLVGNDGGSMHLGDAVGCKVVSIVPGIEYPDSIEPWNNRQFAVRHSVACAPCYNFLSCPLGHNKCMVDLPLEPVIDNCRRQLARCGSAERPALTASTSRNTQ